MKKLIGLLTVFTFVLIISAFSLVLPVKAATGDLVGTVNFDTLCASGVGVGIAYDGQNLWYSCTFQPGTNLYRADSITGIVSASYLIPNESGSGLGALAYDAGRNAIWAGWSGGTGEVILIQLDGLKNVVSSATAFHAPEAIFLDLDDGLAYDASDDTLYISGDIAPDIHHYQSDGTHLGSFAKAPGSGCGNSGLAIGGDLLYEGFNGCNQVIVVDKSDPLTPVFSFSTAVGQDPGFRDEDLECDTNTFANQGKHVMWSVEAYDANFGGQGNRRALAFEIPFGSCGIGGNPQFTISGNKFFDINGNGLWEAGETGLADWTINNETSGTSVVTGNDGSYEFSVGPGNYIVSETLKSGWMQTKAPTNPIIVTDSDITDADFGNACLVPTGGKSKGFWTNKNGEATLNDSGTLAPELALLSSLNLRNENGSDFDPATYASLKSWLGKESNATNMAYMLSAQLAAVELSVEAGLTSGTASVVALNLLSFAPVPGLSALGIISVSDLMSAANTELGLHGLTKTPSDYRLYQEALKNALEQIAINSLVQVCEFTFTASDSAYYNGPTSSDPLYATGPISFTWDPATGNVTGGLWTEIVPPGVGTNYFNDIVSGTVLGGVVNLTFLRTLPAPYGPFSFTGTLAGGVLSGLAGGPYLLEATGIVTP